jgi:hypothetical protein
MRRLLAMACCWVGLVVPAAARAAGGPVPPVMGGAGVHAPGGTVNYVTLFSEHGTIVERVRRADGTVEGYATLPEPLGVPGVTYGGEGTGLSADGRKLVLTGFSTSRTRLAVLDTRHLRIRAHISLPGYATVDAISPHGRWLYLIHYRSANDPLHYEVRAYDMRAGHLLPKPIVDPREPDEKMLGMPMTRTTSADGRWVYTLYQRPDEAPFVHALDTSRRTAACIDLPMVSGDFESVRMRLAAGTLTVTGERGPEAFVNTRTFAVRAPKPPAAPPAHRAPPARDSGGPPWILLLVVAPALLAGLALLARRRRAAPPAVTVERRQHVMD